MKAGAPKGNQNAKKAEVKSSHIHLKVTPTEKAQVVRDAGGQKMSDYIRDKLGLPPA